MIRPTGTVTSSVTKSKIVIDKIEISGILKSTYE